MEYPVIVLTDGLPGLAGPISWAECAGASFFPGAGDGELFAYCGGMPGKPVGVWAQTPVFLAGTCSSTFDLAWYLLGRNLLPDWGAVIARSQEQGRGQLGRHWHSPPGNLYVSFLLPAASLFDTSAAALICSYLILLTLRKMAIPLRLKWPNDLLLEDGQGSFFGKVAGLLLEERQGRVVAGLGINLREAPSRVLLRESHAIPAASLAHTTLAPIPLWLDMLPHMQSRYASSLCGHSAVSVLNDLERFLAWKGERVRAGEPGREAEGILKGLGPEGELLIAARHGVVSILSGSVARLTE